MQGSKQPRRRNTERERKRLETTRKRHGADFWHRNAKKAGKLSTTHFNSGSASEAAKKRWEAYRRERGVKNAEK